MSYNLKLTGKGNSVLKKEKSGLNPKDVSLALKQLGECGAGFDTDYGLLILPKYNSASGDIDEYVGVYIVDEDIVFSELSVARQAVCAFRANDYVTATSVTIAGCPTSGSFSEGETIQLTATVNPTGALQTGTWTTSSAARATVNSSGLVTIGDIAGSVTITFTSTHGPSATCVITSLGAI